MSEQPKKSKKRFVMLGLVFISVIINYMDRSNISVAAFAISEELDLSSVQLGLLFSAFGWTYATLQIPGGVLVDRVRPRILYTAILSFWSVATLLQGFVNSFIALLGFRMSIGVFETPSFPTNNRIVTSWFPKQERARAIAIYTSGQYMGLAILTPSLIAIQSWVGWRGLFIASGVIGLIWAGVWYTFYRDPLDHKGVNEAELNYIKKGGALVNKGREEKKAKWDWRELKYAFQFRKLWGIYIGQFCIGATFIFFLTWFPTYLVKYRGMDFLQSGFLASIPFIAAFFGVLSSGFISDTLVNRGYSTAVARKAPVIIGMFLSTTIIGANYVDSSFLLITFLSIAFFGNGFASITWVFVSAMAPERLIGLIGGVFNFMGGLSAIIVPAAIGFLVTDDNFSPALIFIAILTFIGLLSFIFLVGKIERIAIPESSTT